MLIWVLPGSVSLLGDAHLTESCAVHFMTKGLLMRERLALSVALL